jgi:hypothetical protein
MKNDRLEAYPRMTRRAALGAIAVPKDFQGGEADGVIKELV